MQKYNLNANEECFISSFSKLITYFINNLTLGMTSQSIAYLLSGSEHIYVYIYIGLWALKLMCTQYGFYGLGNLEECKENLFF